MTHRYRFILTITLALCLSACSSNHSDAKKILSNQSEIFETYITAMDNVKSSEDLIKAINTFTADMADMIPKLHDLSKKYPKFQTEPPVELKGEIDKIAVLSKKMAGAVMKNLQYMGDPNVQKALQDQGRIMGEALTKAKKQP